MKVPTGVRAEIDTGWVLQIFPRSSLGFKFRLQLNNTVGIIDSDYFYSDNEGHMFIKVTNDSREGKTVELGQGAGFAQGIFIPYGITADDECSDVRNGGFWKYGCKVGRNIWEVVDRGHTAAGAGPSQRGSTPDTEEKGRFPMQRAGAAGETGLSGRSLRGRSASF